MQIENVGGKLNREIIAHVRNARDETRAKNEFRSEIDFHVQQRAYHQTKVRLLPTKVSNSSVFQVLHFVDAHDPVFSGVSFLQNI